MKCSADSLIEDTRREHGHWWQHLLLKKTFTHWDYIHHMVRVMVWSAWLGSIIPGPENTFGVRIKGRLQAYASRVSEREGLTMDRNMERIQSVDSGHSSNMRASPQADQMVEIIYYAMQAAWLPSFICLSSPGLT
jgi:hypothetical protein